jgi:diguanylate cyclase (GGDEF)-like protein
MHATIDNAALATLAFAVLAIAVGLFALLWALRRWVRWRRGKPAAIAHQAMHDALTGLPNREGAWQHLDRCLADRDAVAALGGIAVLRIDLDGFKGINDQLGQEAGDELLRQVARRIRASLRDTDFVARLGGDEFLVTLPQESGRENTIVVATKLVAALAAGYEVFGHTVGHVTASIGVSRCPGDAAEREALLNCADLALNQAKSAGRNTYRIFEPATINRPL